MNNLLIFFALPIAVIVISIALQKILKCPPLVAAIIFSIFLIVTFIVNNLNFLIVAIVYAIISFITATIICLIGRLKHTTGNCNNNFIALNNCNCENEVPNNCGCNYQITNSDGLSANVNIIPNSNNNNQNNNINSCGCCRRRG